MTTTVFFVRHGSHGLLGRTLCGRQAGVGLSPHGRAEAARAARHLSRSGARALYVSPLQRAQETADTIAAGLDLPPQTAPALNEIDLGAWTGQSFDSLHGDPDWRRWNEARDHHRPPEGESMLEVQARVAAFLSQMVAWHPDASVIAVSHSDVIKAALAYAMGLSLDHHDRLEVSPGSVSIVVAGEWGVKVHSMNEAPP